jgi:phosphoserine phosphatase RsbU/P
VRHGKPTVGVFLDWFANHWALTVSEALIEAAAERNVHLVFFAGGGLYSDYANNLQRNVCFRLAAPRNVDGLIALALENSATIEQRREFMQSFGLPFSSVEAALGTAPSVKVSATGLKRAISHLIEVHARRRIAFIRGPIDNVAADERYEAYRSALAEHGLAYDPTLVGTGNFNPEQALAVVRSLLGNSAERFDAVVAANDSMAIAAIKELRRAGLNVPNEVSVVGFDDDFAAPFSIPPLTTVRQPYRELARSSLHSVLSLLWRETPERLELIDSELLVRESCGCLPGETRRYATSYPAPLDDSSSQEWRRQMAEQIRRAATAGGGPWQHTDWDRKLAQSFMDELLGTTPQAFQRTFIELVRQVAIAEGDVAELGDVVSLIQSYSMHTALLDSEHWTRAEAIWLRARQLVNDASRRQQARLRTEAETAIHVIASRFGQLLGSFDLPSVSEQMAEHLPVIGIPGAYLVLYEGGEAPSPTSRVVFAMKHGKPIPIEEGWARFPTAELLPDALWQLDAPAFFAVESLFFEKRQIGYLVLEPQQLSMLLDTVREQVSATLQGGHLMRVLAEQRALRADAEQKSLERDLVIARQIQTAMLPDAPSLPGLELSCAMKPAAEVGGDYFDVIPAADGGWLGMGDVSGHGLTAGMIMLMLQSAFSALVRQAPDAQPSEILNSLNGVLYENLRDRLKVDEYATLCILRWRKNGRLDFAGGHEALLLRRAGAQRAEWIESLGTWMAATESVAGANPDQELTLAPGDTFVLYTDGITEALSAHGQLFGPERLQEVLERHIGRSVAEIRDAIMRAVQDWSVDQRDDLSVVVARCS